MYYISCSCLIVAHFEACDNCSLLSAPFRQYVLPLQDMTKLIF